MVEHRPPKPGVVGSSPTSPAFSVQLIKIWEKSSVFSKIGEYFSGVQVEMKKVTWLSKNEMLGSTIIVLVFAAIVSIFLFAIDFGLGQFLLQFKDIWGK